jgi:hypothetical protein
MAVLSVGQAESNFQQAVAGETAANNNYTAALEQKNSAKKAWISSGGAPGTPEAAAYKSASANYDAASGARDEAIANSTSAEQDLNDAKKATDTASSETAADKVANEEDRVDPATQNTGTDASANGTALSDEEKSKLGDDQAPPGERSADPVENPAPATGDATQNDDSVSNAEEQPKQVGGNNATPIFTNNNILGNYASYTYNLNWHVLTKDDYHNMLDGNPWRPSRNLVSGANRYGEPYTGQTAGYGTYRDPAFLDDFYFSDFKMQTVIGLNSNARGTNAIDISFTIIEPYGMTLMDRILDINVNELGAKNYLDNPYLIELNFFGMNEDDGEPTLIPGHTKWFPIKLTGMKIKASVHGAEYAISAVPFNHQALFESLQDIKTRMEVTASTVGEYFDTSVADPNVIKQTDSIREKNAQREAQDKKDAANNAALRKAAENDPRLSEAAVYEPVRTTTKTEVPPTITTKSFAAAYNAWNRAEQKNGNVGYADQIFFNIDPEIRDSKIVDPKKNSIRDVPATTAKDQSRAAIHKSSAAGSTTNGGRGSQAPKKPEAKSADFTASIHSLDAGTKVQDIINLVMPNSEFFKKQITDPATEAKNKKATQCDFNDESKPFYMYKVIPEIRLGDYDRERNVWGKSITFNIKKYAVYNNRDHRVPKSLPPKAIKHYDYFYTGHNTDVINFDIEFNALYYTAVNVDKGKVGNTSGASAQDDTNKNKDAPDTQCANVIDPHMTKPVSQTQQTSAGGVLDNSDTVNAASVMQSFYTSAAGDMISIKLQILGDPEFIKQDDIFVTPTVTGLNTGNQFVEGTQSLAMDNGEIYCYLTFKTPVDFDDNTGLMRQDGKYAVSSFSGYYRVLTVESEFKGGKFTQTLDLTRYPNQPAGLTNQDPGKGKNDRPEPETVTNPTESKNNVEQPPAENIAEPAAAPKEPEENSQTPPAEPSPEPVVDTEYSGVAEKGETKTMDEATSADGNTVPVQSADAKPDPSPESGPAQIQALSSQNQELQAKNEALRQQNSVLSQQGNTDQVLANNNVIYQNNATMAANGDKAAVLGTKYKLDVSTVTSRYDGTVIKLG